MAETQYLLAIWLTDVPREMLVIFDEVLKAVVLELFPYYNQVMGHRKTIYTYKPSCIVLFLFITIIHINYHIVVSR